MSLQSEIDASTSKFLAQAPSAITAPIKKSIYDFSASFDYSSVIKVGDILPPFTLQDALGNQITSTSLLAKGPLLITFYRGSWCPICNLTLHHFQTHLPSLQAADVQLIAISPMLPDSSLSFTQKTQLEFPVLSDPGNEYAKQLGLLFQMPEELRDVFEKAGHDLRGKNGDDTFTVPVPGTFLIDGEGRVRNRFVEADYRKRVDAETVLGWVEGLDGERIKR